MVKKARRRSTSSRHTAAGEQFSREFLRLSPIPDNVDELDLHGMTVDEALPALEAFLYCSFRRGRHRVRVVHGKGTGVLKTEVSRYLSGHLLVSFFRPSDSRNGGAGATEVQLSD